jgi:AMP nucleosidase
MISTGIKTEKSDKLVTDTFVKDHIKIGIEALQMLEGNNLTVKHLIF